MLGVLLWDYRVFLLGFYRGSIRALDLGVKGFRVDFNGSAQLSMVGFNLFRGFLGLFVFVCCFVGSECLGLEP